MITTDVFRVFQIKIFEHLKILFFNQKTIFTKSLCQTSLHSDMIAKIKIIASKIIYSEKRYLFWREKIRKDIYFVIFMDKLSGRQSQKKKLIL